MLVSQKAHIAVEVSDLGPTFQIEVGLEDLTDFCLVGEQHQGAVHVGL